MTKAKIVVPRANKLSKFLLAIYDTGRFSFGDHLGRKTITTEHIYGKNETRWITLGKNDDEIFFTILTKEALQPSYKDLNKSNDDRRSGHNLPEKRRAVVCKGEFLNGKITLYPNPEYRNQVKSFAYELGAEVGEDISYSPQCWESFHDGLPPILGGGGNGLTFVIPFIFIILLVLFILSNVQ